MSAHFAISRTISRAFSPERHGSAQFQALDRSATARKPALAPAAAPRPRAVPHATDGTGAALSTDSPASKARPLNLPDGAIVDTGDESRDLAVLMSAVCDQVRRSREDSCTCVWVWCSALCPSLSLSLYSSPSPSTSTSLALALASCHIFMIIFSYSSAAVARWPCTWPP